MIAFVVAALSLAGAAVAMDRGDVVYLAEPIIPHQGTAMAPRPEYALWWKLTERCAGKTADLADFHFYVVPGVAAFSDKQLEGEANSTTKRIILAGRMVDSGGVVRHEMLHALIAEHGHPAEYFQRRCSGVVDCPLQCWEDGAVQWVQDTTSSIVSLDSVDVSSSIDPALPSFGQDSGWFAITVLVTNPHPYPVRVLLASSRGHAVSFGWSARVCGHTEAVLGANVPVSSALFAIGSGQTLRREFDLHVSANCLVYQPYFNTRTLAETQVAAAQ